MNALSVVPFLQERKSVLEKYFWDWGTSSKRHARSTGLPAGVFVLPEVFCCFLSVFAKAWLKVWSFVNTCSFKIRILLLWVTLRLYLPLLTISLRLVNDLVRLVYDFISSACIWSSATAKLQHSPLLPRDTPKVSGSLLSVDRKEGQGQGWPCKALKEPG